MINDTINDLEMMGIQVQSFILQVSGNDYPVCQPKCGNVFACHTLCKNKTNTTHSHDEERKRELERKEKGSRLSLEDKCYELTRQNFNLCDWIFPPEMHQGSCI